MKLLFSLQVSEVFSFLLVSHHVSEVEGLSYQSFVEDKVHFQTEIITAGHTESKILYVHLGLW